MPLHAPTLAIAAIAAMLLQAIGMFYVWYAQFRSREVAQIAIGSALTALGVVLALARPHLHALVTHVLANLLMIGGQMLISFAVARFVGKRVPLLLVFAVPAVAALLIAVFTFVEPRLYLRIATYSGSMSVAAGIMATALLDVPRGPLRLTHWPLGMVALAQALLTAGRTFYVLISQPQYEQLFESAPLQTLWFTQAIIFVDLTLVGLALMITQRPRLELNRHLTHDRLTGALNRRAFDRLASSQWSRSVRKDEPLSILVFVLDGYDALSDIHGHGVGDLCLKTVADQCRSLFRREDLLRRSGRNEFTMLLPRTAIESAIQQAERLRRATAELTVALGAASIGMTISVGIAVRAGAHRDLEATVTAAAGALHRARSAGTNRIAVAHDG
jgi:diguanylate cyclase (GGDEF)-like protein